LIRKNAEGLTEIFLVQRLKIWDGLSMRNMVLPGETNLFVRGGGMSEMRVKSSNKYLFLPWLCLFALVSPSQGQDSLDPLFQKTGVSRVRVTVANSEAATIPLIDAHNHLNGNISAEALTGPMDRAGVKRMVLLPRHYRSPKDGGLGSDEQARDYARSHPGKFIPFIGGQRDELGKRSRAWQDLSALDPLLLEMRDKLESGEFYGLGEFILVHHAYEIANTPEAGGEVRLPADSKGLREIAKLAARHGAPVLFHAEAEPEVVEQVTRLIEGAPDTRFIWAHNCGRGSADQTRRLLSKFPNLSCDLGTMFNGPYTHGGYGKFWPRKTPWVHLVQRDDGSLIPEMKELFESFPDRFTIGTDIAHTPLLKHYEYRIAIFRVMLLQLSAPTARKIGYQNAEALFGKPAGAK
jgi:hypothetical protein